jgi:hypothetical protein
MKKLIGLAVLVCVISALGMAQERPLPEVYGGYQFTSTDGGWHANGWNGAANYYITRWLGVTGDFSGVYNSGLNLYTYTGGPVVSTHRGNYSPFVHALFGGAHAGGPAGGANGTAMMFGGGLDIGKKRFAVRAVQFDWMPLRFAGITDKNNFRLNTGLMYRF